MKKLIAGILVVALAFTSTACTGGGNPAAQNSSASVGARVVTVAVFMPHLDNPFMNRLNDAVKKYAKEAGYEVISYLANNDPATQALQIEEAVAEGVSALILNPCSSELLASAISSAKQAGIPVVTLHGTVSTQEDCVSAVGPNFTSGGEQAMAQAMRDLPEGGNIAVLKGAKEESAQIAISAGYPRALAGQEARYPVVAEAYANWNAESAHAVVKGWLDSDLPLQAIVCNNDGMVTGALAALAEAGKTGAINLYGLDAQDNILDAIKNGSVKATIYADFDAEARQSVEVIKNVLAGNSVKKEYLLPMFLVSSENIDNYRK